MLTKDPKKRISAKEALKHKWFEIADKIEVDEQHAKETMDNL